MTSAAGDPAAERGLGALGAALLDAGYATTDVSRILADASDASGRAVTVGVLPTAVFVTPPEGTPVHLSRAMGAMMTFEQVGAIATTARHAQDGRLEPDALPPRLAEVRSLPPRYPAWLAVLGSGLMSGGISVVFRTTWWAVALDLVLGMAVGLLLLGSARAPRLGPIVPFVAAFGVALVVYGAAAALDLGGVPLYVVAAPIVTLIPGASITNGVLEVAAGDTISGGSRLVSGALMWFTLALGIAGGAAVIGESPTHAAAGTFDAVPGWAAWPAIVALTLGVGLFFGAAVDLGVALLGSLALTYAIVSVGDLWLTSPVASGLAAALVLPATRLAEVVRPQWPSTVTFRPAFWLLVPGSLGLVAVSDLGGTGGTELLSEVATTVVALAIGVQLGALVSTAIQPRRTRAEPAAI